jgi:hypothetical protein
VNPAATTSDALIDLRGVVKVYDTGEVPFTALKGVDLTVKAASSSAWSGSPVRARRPSST